MTGSVIVWDQKGDPPNAIGEVLCWQSYAHGDRVSSVPRYLEDHAERLRAKYVAFIHDLGESRIDGRRVVDHLDMGDGFSLWWMTQVAEKNPIKSPRIYDCLRLMALEEILLDKKPSELTFHSSDQSLAQAMQRLCLNLQIAFAWRPGEQSKKIWTLRRLYRALPYPVQGVISLRHIVLRWPLRKLQKPKWFSGEGAVFLCSYFIHLDPISCAQGLFCSRQWGGLPKYLHDSGRRTNWIQHFLVSPVVPDVRTGLGWLRQFNLDANSQGYHTFLDSYLTWGIVVSVLKVWFWLITVSWRLRHIQSAFYPHESASWLWPILRDDWLTSLNGQVAIRNGSWVALFDAALKDIPSQKIGLYLCENQGWERALLRAWRKHGHGEIIGVIHSTVPFWWLCYVDDPRSLNSRQNCALPSPDRLAVNGAVARRAFAAAGYPAEQLVEVEALRYLALSRGDTTSGLDSARRCVAKPPISKSPGYNVVVLGDMIPASMHDFLSLLEDTMKLLPSGYKFTIKSHPGYAVKLTDYPGLQADETSEALDRILGEYDIALAINSTSASVDAYVAGLPVIVGLAGGDLNLSPLRSQPDVRFFSTPEELAEALQAAANGMATSPDRKEWFFMDPDLPRWRRLLSQLDSPRCWSTTVSRSPPSAPR